MNESIKEIEKEFFKKDVPVFGPGDTVRVYVRITEAREEMKKKETVEKTKVQPFQGIVIRKRGAGISANFTVRKVSQGIGIERTFPVHSPFIERIEVLKKGKVRRAKLYYMRERFGKKARIKEKK